MGTELKPSAEERRKLEQLEKKFTDKNADVYVLDPRDLAKLWVADRTSKGVKPQTAQSELRAAEASFGQKVDRVAWEWNWHHRSPYAAVQFWTRVFGAPY